MASLAAHEDNLENLWEHVLTPSKSLLTCSEREPRCQYFLKMLLGDFNVQVVLRTTELENAHSDRENNHKLWRNPNKWKCRVLDIQQVKLLLDFLKSILLNSLFQFSGTFQYPPTKSSFILSQFRLYLCDSQAEKTTLGHYFHIFRLNPSLH